MQEHKRAVARRVATALFLGIFGVSALLAQTTTAREPPPCKKPAITVQKAMVELRKWKGFAPIRSLELTETHIGSCLNQDGTARLVSMVIATHKGVSTRWVSDFILSVNNKTGKPSKSKAAIAQIKRIGERLVRLPKTMLKDPIVAGWITIYGAPKEAMFDDEGGHGDPCFELMQPPKGAELSLNYCGGGKGLRSLSLRNFTELPLPALVSLGKKLRKKVAPCGMGATRIVRMAPKGSEQQWRVNVQLSGPEGCKGRVEALGSEAAGWKLR